MRRFNLERFCALSQLYQACFARIVPSIVLDLANNPIVGKYDLSSYIALSSSASLLTKELQIEAQNQTGLQFIQESGMSEASGGISICHVGKNIYGSCGTLVPNIKAKIVDEYCRELGIGESGELCFKGPNIMIGYIDNLQATKEAIDDDGFLHTGDIGYIDKDGNLFISGRKKELIKYNGFQVAPLELEGILTSHPAVIDSAVIPVYDKRRASEIPKAFVVVDPKCRTPKLPENIREWVDSRVIGYKRLRGGVEIVDVIPKSVSGKVLRRILKEREEKNMDCFYS